MRSKFTLLFILLFSLSTLSVKAQCGTTNIAGDYIVNSSIILSGTYSVTGRFVVPSNVTVFVNKYSSNGCGKLTIYCKTAVIQGTINADDAGYTGGTGGLPGTSVTSLTGDIVSLTACSNKDNTGQVTIQGGLQGITGSGPGAGLPGTAGQSGSGPKQQCLNTSDEAGMIGSGGGAGGGAGGSYGGNGGNGGNGGSGTNSYTATGVNVSVAYSVVSGSGGTGGTSASAYGTVNASDIDMGSGGAGAGGGALSYVQGGNGGKGGNGGGMVKIVAQDSLVISGMIMANGTNGLNGGLGGDGGVTVKCCTDGCDDCGEANLSCGAGGGSGAGGGAGGGIYMESPGYMNITGTMQAKGGNGGAAGAKGNGVSCNYSATFCGTQALTSGSGNNGNMGGAAGGGRIKIFASSCVTNNINPTTSINGGTGFITAAAGTYSVMCSNVTSIEENTAYHKLMIFPNPATDLVTIKFRFPQFLADAQAEFQIYDLNAKLVLSQKCDLNTKEEQELYLTELSSGIYILKLISNDVIVTEKIIKH
ncbi:MAG: T9SS type A sorting domain-containing protein [Bacteroidota bacterium]